MIRNYFDRWYLERQLEDLGFYTNGLARGVQQWDHAGVTTVVQVYGGSEPEVYIWDRKYGGKMRFGAYDEAIYFLERVLAQNYGRAINEYFLTRAA